MQKIPKNTVIIGLGKTGLSCVNFCQQHCWPVAVTDSRAHPPGIDRLDKNIKTSFGKMSAELISQADLLIVSPGVSLKEPVITKAIKRGIPYVGDIELFAQNISAPVITITGSNAKSTVTTLVGEMARRDNINVQVGGNIGTPVLDLPAADLYVLELSSFQLETTFSLRAKVATVLNICEDHLDRYVNMQEYVDAKLKIYQNCDVGVFNRIYYYPEKSFAALENRFCDEGSMVKLTKSFSRALHSLRMTKKITFGLDAPQENQYGIVECDGEKYLAHGKKTLLNTKNLKLIGQHDLENALAALAIGDAAGFTQNSMLQALKEFTGLPHRCQLVRILNNVAWYNDSKGTNVGATMTSLKGLGENISGKIILIAGGLSKNADFTPLQSIIKKYVRKTILIGEATKELEKILQNTCAIKKAETLKQAVNLANDAALPNDLVLLSPACASFDMFDDYQHRGNEFIKIVGQL